MDWTNNFEQFLRQLSDLQIGFLNSWNSTAPSKQSFNSLNFREIFDYTLRFQEEVLTSSLEFQALLARMSIETQKQFWEGYFNMFRKVQPKKAE
jgi:hypothetical protein